MSHHIEGPILEDLYHPNNQKGFVLSRASVVAAVTSSNFNKPFRVLSYLYSFHHMINMMVTSAYLLKYIYLHCVIVQKYSKKKRLCGFNFRPVVH